MHPVKIAREIASTHYGECRANMKLFRHRCELDSRLVGVSPIMVQLIIRIAVALFLFWLSRNYDEAPSVMSEEESVYLDTQDLKQDEQ